MSDADAEAETFYWGMPTPARSEHIFGEDGRSLCGKYGFFPTDRGTVVTDEDVRTGDDCKRCAEKCDLVTVTEEDDDE